MNTFLDKYMPIIVGGVIFTLAGYAIAIHFTFLGDYLFPTQELPQGWSIVTDGQGHYSCQYPTGYIIAELFHSKNMAIARAQSQAQFEEKQEKQRKLWKPLPP